MTEDTKAEMTVLYNGACPVCRREIGAYRRLAGRAGLGIGWSDITDDRERLRACDLSPDEGARRLHVLDKDGRVLAGVDAFALLWRQLPGWRWAGRLVGHPFGRVAATLVYEGLLAPILFFFHRRRMARRNGHG